MGCIYYIPVLFIETMNTDCVSILFLSFEIDGESGSEACK